MSHVPLSRSREGRGPSAPPTPVAPPSCGGSEVEMERLRLSGSGKTGAGMPKGRRRRERGGVDSF